MEPKIQYLREMRSRFGYSATWLPTIPVTPGDVGRMEGYSFERLGSVRDFGIPVPISQAASMGALDYASAGAVEFSFSPTVGATDAVGLGLAAVGETSIKFSREGAIVFHGEQCQVEQLRELGRMEATILSEYDAGRWPIEYVVVTEVVRAQNATVLISGGKNATASFSGHLSNHGLALELGVKAQILRSRGIYVKIIGEGAMTPLFRARGVRHRLLRQPSITSRGDAAAVPPSSDGPSYYLSDVDYENYS